MEQKSIFSSSLVAGVLVSVALIIFKLVLFLLDVDGESYIQFGYYIVFALGLAWAIYSVRNSKLDGFATYGKAFMIGLYASISIAVIMAVYTYVYMKYIDPSFVDNLLANAEDKMIETNPDMSEEDLNKALEMTKMFMQPGLMSVFSIFGSIITGAIFSLIVAIFAKREQVSIEV
ncbi:MAG: hypothetical protein DRJ09_08260 [Bacteroidetes bacterium]|nr:MAG: hypothetical protein DRJ09_08260 [Bacteroidota bacterium]